ncbi:glycosyltransferase family 2 protein [Chloroflexota bacterium]
MMSLKQAKISIITTSYTMDRLKDMIELLDSIQAQTYQNIETVCVAERSPELAASIRKHIAEKGYSHMQVLYNDGDWGVSAARNLAIEQVKGDIIAFVDDDALLFPNWAEETVKTYAEDNSVIGVAGPILPLLEQESMSWFPREFYWIFSCTYWDITEKTEIRNGYGTNISFHREAFDSSEPFRKNLGVKGRGESGWLEPGAEEFELSLRIRRKTGKHIIYNPQVRVKHKVYRYRFRAEFIAKRAYWEGYAKAMFNRWDNSADSKTVLSTEHELLHRILFKLLPQTLGRLFRQPLIALRQLWLVTMVLSCVASGYFGFQFSSLFSRR